MKTLPLIGLLTATSLVHANTQANINLQPQSHTEAQPAKKIKKEKRLKTSLYKTNEKAYFKDEQGTLIPGAIYVQLTFKTVEIEDMNIFRAEAQGSIYFKSDEEIEETFHGNTYKSYIHKSLTQYDDDDITVFDLINSTATSKDYFVYGCSSTYTDCTPEAVRFNISNNNKALLKLTVPESINVGMGIQYKDSNGVLQTDLSPYIYENLVKIEEKFE